MFIYPYFVVGVFVSRYDLFRYLFGDRRLATMCILTYVLSYTLRAGASDTLSIFSKMCAVYCYTWLFYILKDRQIWATRGLQWLGQRSLYIYTLHYFIVGTISIPSLRLFLGSCRFPYAVELVVVAFLAIIVAAVSAMIGEIISRCKVGKFVLTGKFE